MAAAHRQSEMADAGKTKPRRAVNRSSRQSRAHEATPAAVPASSSDGHCGVSARPCALEDLRMLPCILSQHAERRAARREIDCHGCVAAPVRARRQRRREQTDSSTTADFLTFLTFTR